MSFQKTFGIIIIIIIVILHLFTVGKNSFYII